MRYTRILLLIISTIFCFSIKIYAQNNNFETNDFNENGVLLCKAKENLTAILFSEINTVSKLHNTIALLSADSSCKVLNYQLLIFPMNGNVSQIKIIGKTGLSELNDKLKQLKTGDVLQLNEIVMQCKNESKARIIKKLNFEVK